LNGKHVVFVGDGNNVARSLAMICGKLGAAFTLASPPDYALEQEFADKVMAACPGMDFTMCHDPFQAVQYADAIYADTFVSMGQEEEKAKRLESFKDFQVNEKLMAEAPSHAIALHCLPAYRGVEITDAVMDGPQSRVFQQAHNRLHAQKGMLAVVMG
ncbi:MAG: ornithine carbamoyltransferase, partial [Phycisphaeraceae bacterium]